MTSEPPVLSARGLVREEWGRGNASWTLGPLDLEVVAGECLGVVGPNGAGKTTLLRCLAGLRKPSRGALAHRGRNFAELSRRELARRIAYVPQVRPASVPLSVREAVELGRYPHLSPFQLAPSAADHRAVDQALAAAGIESFAERPLDELSGGERQMAWIAAALAQEAEVLILDEPTTHLDPRHQRDVAGLLHRLHREGGATILLATHDLELAGLLGDRVLALAAGRIFALGEPSEVLAADSLAALFDAPFRAEGQGRAARLALAP
jgi:ABC-type cobalamin/Fe3+-siderophores transport system ATPase subunit